jgi:hypothetical protein
MIIFGALPCHFKIQRWWLQRWQSLRFFLIVSIFIFSNDVMVLINFQENLDCHAAQFDWHTVKWTLEFSKAACSEKNCLAG